MDSRAYQSILPLCTDNSDVPVAIVDDTQTHVCNHRLLGLAPGRLTKVGASDLTRHRPVVGHRSLHVHQCQRPWISHLRRHHRQPQQAQRHVAGHVGRAGRHLGAARS